jgi:uncharacterized protein YjbI with pentapeptide repeats
MTKDDVPPPFEYCESDGRPTLLLHGKDNENRSGVDKDKTRIIMDAIAGGWNIDIIYAIIDGDIDIGIVYDKLDRDDEDRKIINGNIAICNSEIHSNVYFRKASFSGYVVFSESSFDSDADFWKASFGDDVIFREASFSGYLVFGEASFGSNACFRKASFGVDADFTEASFGGNADFQKVSFGVDADFTEASFGGDAKFWEASFSGNANFRKASFSDKADFTETSFKNVYFGEASFSGDADFTKASFKNVYFGEVSFSGDADFTEASFNGKVVFKEASFRNAYFREAYFNVDADFTEASFNDKVVFNYSHLSKNVNLEQANLDKTIPESLDSIGDAYIRSSVRGAHCFFQKAGNGYWNNGKYQEASNSFRNAKVEYDKEGKYDEAAIMYKNVAEQYMNLKNYTLAENCFREARIEYNNGGKYGEVGKMYVMEQEAIRLSLKHNKSNNATMAWLWILKHTCNYGESPKLLIGISIIIVLWFAFIYLPIMPDWWIFPVTFNGYPFHNWFGHGNIIDNIIDGIGFNICTAIYYSVVTLLSFGDLTPVNLTGKLWIGLEVICGYVMFGILITLVARKMTRS